MSNLKRAEILANALAERFRGNPERLADASGVFVRQTRLRGAAVLYAPGVDGEMPPVVAVAEGLSASDRQFLLAWALGLWALGFVERGVYWRGSGFESQLEDPADVAATAFADAFLRPGSAAAVAAGSTTS